MRSINLPRRGLASAAATSSPPFLWKVAHGMFSPETPLSSPLPGIPSPVGIPVPSASAVTVSRLSNGIRVASQDSGGPVAALGVFVGAGSRHENPYTSGSTHILEHIAFKGSKNRTKYRMTRDIERTGAAFSACASRETILYAADTMQTNAADVLSILAESATAHRIAVADTSSVEHDGATAEIAAQVAAIKSEQKTFDADPSGKVTEAIHAAAYHGNTLGTFC